MAGIGKEEGVVSSPEMGVSLGSPVQESEASFSILGGGLVSGEVEKRSREREECVDGVFSKRVCEGVDSIEGVESVKESVESVKESAEDIESAKESIESVKESIEGAESAKESATETERDTEKENSDIKVTNYMGGTPIKVRAKSRETRNCVTIRWGAMKEELLWYENPHHLVLIVTVFDE